MKNKVYFTVISLIMCLLIFLTGCMSASGSETANKSNDTSASLSVITVKYDTEDYYFDWSSESHSTVNLNSGSQLITKSGIYEITGTLNDDSLIVNVDKSQDKGIVYLVLNNANISSSDSAPIYIKDAKKVVLILENETQNTIYQGSSVITNEDEEPSAAIFSKADLTITGGGSLNVTSDYNDGITSKDDLKITDGTIAINAKQDGIVGKDLLAVENGYITITAGKDGMRSTNDTDEYTGNIAIKNGNFNITANNDGLDAYSLLQVDGGTFNINTGGGYTGITKTQAPGGGMGGPRQQNTNTTTSSTDTQSNKALKSSNGIIINSGTFNISSPDDAIHSNADIAIAGGAFTIKTEDDGIHSDTNLEISGGEINIENCYEGLEAKNLTINGGKININSSDDAFNVNDSSGVLTINGGETYMNVGGDGVDSNGSINMTGGTVYVDGPTNSGNGSIDYEGTFTITGGSIVAAGSSGMAMMPNSGTQPSILMNYSSTQPEGTQIVLKDNSGNTLASFTPTKQYSSVAISSPSLKTGTSYTLYKNSEAVVTFTPNSTFTYLNESGITERQNDMPGGRMRDSQTQRASPMQEGQIQGGRSQMPGPKN